MASNERPPMTILFTVVLVDMLGLTLVIPFLTYFIQDLAAADGITDVGSRDFWVGVTIAIYSFAQFLFTPILGSLSDRLGRRPILMFGLLSNSVFFIVFGLSSSLTMALVARFLAGAGNGSIAVTKAYIGDISEPEKIPARMGMIGAAFGLGFMIGPFIGGVLSDPANSIGGFFNTDLWRSYPYLLPCMFSSLMSISAFLLALSHLPESLPESLRSTTTQPPLGTFFSTVSSMAVVIRLPKISSLVIVNFLFLLGFTMMHGTFILFTSMPEEMGGLGWSEMDNGWIFAFIGLLGVLVQGVLMRLLSNRFRLSSMMITGTLICAIGIASIPYAPADASWLIFGSAAGLAIGNGLFSPTQSSLLTFESQSGGFELGMVMGAQEGAGALARIIGPLLSAYIWSVTVQGTGLWTYHTCFRVAGVVLMLALLLQLGISHRNPPVHQGGA